MWGARGRAGPAVTLRDNAGTEGCGDIRMKTGRDAGMKKSRDERTEA